MEKEFVPYEIALALKELGFDEKCGACYYKKFNNEIGYHKVYRDFNFVQLTVSAPTFSQAFRWFREKHNMIVYIYPYFENLLQELKNLKPDGYRYITFPYGKSRVYKTYEEAELTCLKKLIEITRKDYELPNNFKERGLPYDSTGFGLLDL